MSDRLHPQCENCEHRHEVSRAFTLEMTVTGPSEFLPDGVELIEALEEGLPREWFENTGADWTLSYIKLR